MITVTLNLVDDRPWGIELKIEGIPRDGSCPPGSEGSVIPIPSMGRVELGVKVPEVVQRCVLFPSLPIYLYTEQPESPNLLFLPQRSFQELINYSPRGFSPNLAPPPQINQATGQPSEPIAEKSFLVKYWLPILGIGLFFAAQMGPDQPRGGSAGGGGGGGGGGG